VKRFGLLWVLFMTSLPLGAQDAEVQRYVAMVSNGQIDEVRKEISSLLERYPNNPGVLYVQALVTKEGAEAARIYQSVVDNFPKSAYADAALYRVYQFYYALGLYRTAELKMNQLKAEYPASKYLKADARETVNLAEEVAVPARKAVRDSVVAVPEKPVREGGTTPAAPASAAVPSTSFVLQVGAYGAQANAEKQRKFFSDLGYPVEMITKVRDTKTLIVVLVGSYASYEQAKAQGADIRKKYSIETMVVTR
jgi:cell division septation protein DedD